VARGDEVREAYEAFQGGVKDRTLQGWNLLHLPFAIRLIALFIIGICYRHYYSCTINTIVVSAGSPASAHALRQDSCT